MTLLEEVKAFARDFINGNRTQERLLKVKAAYRQLYGENLRITCETCYIEAIFKILRHMETPKIHTRYRLKKGAILQPFGGGIVTNANLTDAIAEECLRTVRGAASLFAEMPAPPPPEPDLKIVKVGDEAAAASVGAQTKVAADDDLGQAKQPAQSNTTASKQPANKPPKRNRPAPKKGKR